MDRGLVLLIFVIILFVSTGVSVGSVGFSSYCSNNGCEVKASASLISILLSVALFILLLTYRQHNFKINHSNRVRMLRRIGALFIDFMVIMIITSPIATLPILIAEANYTGTFQWSFEREFARSTDGIFVHPPILLTFFLLFYYFYIHPKIGKATVGQYILGYTIKATDDSTPKYGLRVFYSLIALSIWPITIVLCLAKKKRDRWWDTKSNTRAVLFDSENKEDN